jgi:hypothetical protein
MDQAGKWQHRNMSAFPPIADICSAHLWAFRENRIAVRFAAIEAFLGRKWNRELDYRLIKGGHWFRSQRELGIRRRRADALADREYQRPFDQRKRAKVPLAARPPPR